MIKFESMTSEVAKTVASRISKKPESAERYARSHAFDIASNFSDYTEDDAYQAIMAKAAKMDEVPEEDATDWEQEQRCWLIANSKQVIADMRERLDHVEEHFHSEARQRSMARYYRRQIEQETEFLRNEGVEDWDWSE